MQFKKSENAEMEILRYWGSMPIPTGSKIIGVIKRNAYTLGGLLMQLDSGVFVEGTGGSIRTLPQREIKKILNVAKGLA